MQFESKYRFLVKT